MEKSSECWVNKQWIERKAQRIEGRGTFLTDNHEVEKVSGSGDRDSCVGRHGS